MNVNFGYMPSANPNEFQGGLKNEHDLYDRLKGPGSLNKESENTFHNFQKSALEAT